MKISVTRNAIFPYKCHSIYPLNLLRYRNSLTKIKAINPWFIHSIGNGVNKPRQDFKIPVYSKVAQYHCLHEDEDI